MIKFDIEKEKREIEADALAKPAKAAKGGSVVSTISSISSGSSLKFSIEAMASRWKYEPDELAEALQLAETDPEGWARLLAHDEAVSAPHPEEWGQPPETVRCADCSHYQTTNHPHLGHCTQGEIEAVVGLWDSSRHICAQHQPLPGGH